jgi:hypothetical protein
MRRILLSSLAMLSACLIAAGCGSSSNKPPANTNNARLNGTYVFVQQIYTYYSNTGIPLNRSNPVGSALGQNLSAHALSQTANLNRPKPASFKTTAQTTPSQGSDPSDTGIVWGAMAGSLTFDGKGNITGGEIDYNEPQVGYFHDNVTGKYTVYQDNSGTIRFVSTQQGAVFFLNVVLNGSGATADGGQIAESYADSAGNMEIGTGTMLAQSSGLTSGSLNGNYVFGLQGETCYGCSGQTASGDLFAAGVLSANGSGNFTSGQADVAAVYASSNVPLTGTYGQPDANGRSEVSLNSNNAMPQTYALYMASPSTFFLLATDTSSSTAPAYLFGQAGLQSGTFSNASLSGNYVLAENTEDLQNAKYPDTYSDATLALLSAGGGTFTGTGDANNAGKVLSNVPFNYGAYTVQPNGRVTLTGTTPAGAPAPVFWLQSPGFGYGVDQLNGSTLQQPGLLRIYGQPAGGSYSAASMKGYYGLGTIPASTSNSTLLVAVVTADGSSQLSGSGAASFFTNNGSAGATGTANGAYTVSANGRGTITGTNNSIFGNGILYVVSGTQVLTMDVSSGDIAPSLQTFQP